LQQLQTLIIELTVKVLEKEQSAINMIPKSVEYISRIVHLLAKS